MLGGEDNRLCVVFSDVMGERYARMTPEAKNSWKPVSPGRLGKEVEVKMVHSLTKSI